MDVPLLRTMTEKSIMGFGRHTDLSVGQLLALRHTKYLRWVYYNCSKITFTEEILKKIHIGEDYRIDKPGTNKELWKSSCKAMWAISLQRHGLGALKTRSRNKKEHKLTISRRVHSRKFASTKGYLQALNQGKL